MDFEDTPEEAAYRAKVRAWLQANAPAVIPRKKGIGEADEASLAAGREWQKKKAEAGYAQITWPKAWGGGGGTVIESVIFGQEEAKVAPRLSAPFGVGLYLCLPTVMTVADEATKQRFGGPGLRGEEVWCQLFSEPAGGSDLAGARTRAVRADDGSGDWIINGSKIWTSGAQFADFGLLLTRTNPDVVKHKGMTMFWIDMHAPGVEVRPIHQINDGSGFNEVFFTDVRIADSQRLGAVDEGFKVALVTLMHERASAGSNNQESAVEPVLALAKQLGDEALEDPALAEKLAEWYVRSEGVRLTGMRALTALSRGETPGPEGAMGKLVLASLEQDLARESLDLMDQFGIISDPVIAPDEGGFQSLIIEMTGLRVAGGTDEILRNIIAERVLGLPGDIRVDKDVAFKDLPRGV